MTLPMAKQYSINDPVTLGGKVHCWYCHGYLYKNISTKDHFFPKSLGGRLSVRCCSECNSLKGDKTPLQFIAFLRNLKETNTFKENLLPHYDRMINATETLWNKVKWSVNPEYY